MQHESPSPDDRVQRLRPLRIHSEFHRLLTEYSDDLLAFAWLSTERDGKEAVEDGYATLQQRKKELYEWIAANAPRPEELYTIHIRF